jgi:uncharacterized lipoprotein YmbA
MKKLLPLLSLLLVGCVSVGGRAGPDPTRHFVLAGTEEPGDAFSQPACAIAIDRVAIAKFLDRPQIVLRSGEGHILPQEFFRWGEPLEVGIGSALRSGLQRQFPDTLLVQAPWNPGRTPLLALLRLRVDELTSDGREARFAGRCELWDGTGTTLLGVRTLDLRLSDGGKSMAETVENFRRLLANAARAIGDELRRLPPGQRLEGEACPHSGVRTLPAPIPAAEVTVEARVSLYLTADNPRSGERILSRRLAAGERLQLPRGLRLASSHPRELLVDGMPLVAAADRDLLPVVAEQEDGR